jgi:hypothetical protein
MARRLSQLQGEDYVQPAETAVKVGWRRVGYFLVWIGLKSCALQLPLPL